MSKTKLSSNCLEVRQIYCMQRLFAASKTLLIVSLFLSLFSACAEDAKTKTSKPLNPVVVVLAGTSGDVKGAGWSMPDRQFYASIIQWLQEKNGGSLLVYSESTPAPHPVSITILPTQLVDDIYSLEAENIKFHNDSIGTINQRQLGHFFSELDTAIINYKLVRGQDYSYIDQSFNSIARALNSPQFNSCGVKLVYLHTNCLNSVPQQKDRPAGRSAVTYLSNSGAEIYLTTFSDTTGLGNLNATLLDTYERFVGSLKNY